MKLLKLLAVGTTLLFLQSYDLSAMQSDNINKQNNMQNTDNINMLNLQSINDTNILNQQHINNTNIINQQNNINTNILNQQNIDNANILNQQDINNNNIFNQQDIHDNTQESERIYPYTEMHHDFNGQWDRDDIRNIFRDIDRKLANTKISEVLSYYTDKVLEILGCSDDGLAKKSVDKYMRYLIKENIISITNSLEGNFKMFYGYNNQTINVKDEDTIFSIIIEKYIDEYFINNTIYLDDMFKSSFPSGEMLKIVQDHYEVIYNDFKEELDNIEDINFDRLKNNYEKGNQYYKGIISRYILNKLTVHLENYFIANIGKDGWDKCMKKYQKSPHYIKKRLIFQIFEDNIIYNSISRYALPMADFIEKYKDPTLQNEWEEFVLGYYYKPHGDESIKEITEKFLDPGMQNYADKKCTEYLTNRTERDIGENRTLDDILTDYKNEDTKALVTSIYYDLIKEYH